jgi:hypothetical protein
MLSLYDGLNPSGSIHNSNHYNNTIILHTILVFVQYTATNRLMNQLEDQLHDIYHLYIGLMQYGIGRHEGLLNVSSTVQSTDTIIGKKNGASDMASFAPPHPCVTRVGTIYHIENVGSLSRNFAYTIVECK